MYQNIAGWERQLAKARFSRSFLLDQRARNWLEKNHFRAKIHSLGGEIADLERSITGARQDIADFDAFDSNADGFIDGIEDDHYQHTANSTYASGPIEFALGFGAVRVSAGAAARSTATASARISAAASFAIRPTIPWWQTGGTQNPLNYRLSYSGFTTGGLPIDVRYAGPKVFYTVQDEINACRLLAGGSPWPTEPRKAHLGEGLYTWGTYEHGAAYLSLLRARGAGGLRIMEATISSSRYSALHSLDLRTLSDEALDAWLSRHSSLFGEGLPHGFDHIIRETGNFGSEFFFSKDTFRLFDLK